MRNAWERVRIFFLEDLWIVERASRGRGRTFVLQTLRLLAVIIRDLAEGPLTLWAMSLVYTTLLSLVPLLAVSFSVLKAFGVHNAVEPLLLNFLAPLGPTAVDLVHRIVEFVNNMKVGVLGFVGMGMLIYTVIALIQKIEEAFNAIWRVHGLRSILQRFSDYLSVILVGPVLIVSALGLTASLMSTSVVQKLIAIGPVGMLVSSAGKLVPYLLVCAAFMFIYVFVPNTKVRLGPAAVGAVAGGVLWETIGWGFASFVVASTRYGAIYSGFAVLILFMIWLYLSWLILLIGAKVAFYRQNPQFLSLEREAAVPDARLIEQTAVSVMVLVVYNFHDDLPRWTLNALAQRLGVRIEPLQEIVKALKERHLLAETADDPPAYLPARDIGTITLRDVYDSVRRTSSGRQHIAPIEAVESIAARIDEAIGNSLDGTTLGDIVHDREDREETGNGHGVLPGRRGKTGGTSS